jgi:hypothetical protein
MTVWQLANFSPFVEFSPNAKRRSTNVDEIDPRSFSFILQIQKEMND